MSHTTSGVRRRSGARLAWLGLMVAVAAIGTSGVGVAQGPARTMPVFAVDTTWPNLPNNWVVGIVSAISVDQHDNVWIFHRPRSVPEELRARSAPPVLEFDANGRFLQAWGGPGDGYDWPDNEHGIFIDDKDNVWITGSGAANGRSDDMVIKFTNQGKLVMQIGHRSQSKGNADTENLRQPADVFVYPKTNEVFVADGYGNRRVVVYDATTGAFKRMWGAFGNKPEDEAPAPEGGRGRGGRGAQPAAPVDAEGPGSPQFGNRVHAVEISNDGMLYLADRANRRVQVFTPEGKYLTQVFINRTLSPAGSAAGLAFSPDPEQKFLYVADYNNSHLLVLDRKSLEVLYQFGMRSEKPGDFRGPHEISVDSKGNLYVAEVSPGNRAQKFVLKGMSPTPPPTALTAAQLAQSTD